MRERLKSGPVAVKVDVQSTFYDGPSRSLIVEIPGTSRPAERIVMVAHVQEPGANDDGSGCGTLMALVVALHRAIEAGALPAPGRTLTFIWGDEVVGSRQWLTSHPDQAQGRAVHVRHGHDRRGRREDRRIVPDREAAGSVRGVAAALRSAHRVGRERGQGGSR